MPKNKLSDLRNHLFATLEALTEKSSSDLNMPREIEKAKAVAEVAQTIINSAKLEVDYLKVTNQGERAKSEFVDLIENTPPARPALPPARSSAPAAKPAVPVQSNGHAPTKGLSTGKNLGAEIQ